MSSRMQHCYKDSTNAASLLMQDPVAHPGVLGEITALNQVIASAGEAVEGNVCYWDGTPAEAVRTAAPITDGNHVIKRVNLAALARRRSTMLEIGLNAGHSALICLLANPTLHLYSIDLCAHQYTHLAAQHLRSRFGRRFVFWPGDSREVMPRVAIDRPNLKFDLLHVDGGHSPHLAIADMSNALRMAAPGADFVVDDVNAPVLGDALEHVCSLGYLAPLDDYSDLYETVLHQVLRVC